MYRAIKQRRIAACYALAFCRHFATIDQEVFFNTIARLQTAYEHYPVFFGLLHASSIRPKDKACAIEIFAEKHSIPFEFQRLLIVAVGFKDIALLPAIFEALLRRYKKMQRIVDVFVSSSDTLEKEDQETIHDFVSDKIDAIDFIYHFKKDAGLISGLKIQTDSYYYEKSISRALARIEQTMRDVA